MSLSTYCLISKVNHKGCTITYCRFFMHHEKVLSVLGQRFLAATTTLTKLVDVFVNSYSEHRFTCQELCLLMSWWLAYSCFTNALRLGAGTKT